MMQAEGSVEHRPEHFRSEPAAPDRGVEDEPDLGKPVESRLANNAALMLNGEVFPLADSDIEHPLEPASRLFKAVMRRCGPVGGRSRVAQDGMERRKVERGRRSQEKPLGPDLVHADLIAFMSICFPPLLAWGSWLPPLYRGVSLSHIWSKGDSHAREDEAIRCRVARAVDAGAVPRPA